MGKVQHHGRFAFLLDERPGQEDLMLRGPSLRLAMDGDEVQARITPGEKGRPAGEIVKVLKHARSSVTGVLRRAGEGWLAVPEEADERDAVRVLAFAAGIAPRAGEVVVVRITEWPTLREPAGGEVCEALGSPADPGVRMRAVLRTRGLPEGFPDAVLAESRAFPEEVSGEMSGGRLDLRGLPVFTIDGADAKDFDDAVSLEVLDLSRVRLGVHIADVSHYVRKGTALDAEAAARATSIYLADRVVPMLPPNLSDGLCSLMPGVDRLTVSCFMELGPDGSARSSALKESVIRSRRRFTYEEVETAMGGGRVADVDSQVQESILRMRTLSRTLTVRRMRRGALDMTVPEYQVVVDAEGRPVEVVRRPRLGSHRLIEEFMLLANETVARALLARRLPFLSRVHPGPETRKLAVLGAELKKLGAFVPASLTKTPSTALQIVLQKAVGHPLEDTINMLVMRSLKQACYSHAPGGHFGLASQAYCHFTSPIRRYPDLVTHRAVKVLLRDATDPSLAQGLKALGEYCSQRERTAAEAERRSVDILRGEFLKEKVGQVFDGVVSGTAGFGIFVTLGGLGATGLLRGAGAALGSWVRVRLDRVDEGKGELDLSLAGMVRPVASVPAGPRREPSKPKSAPSHKPRSGPGKARHGHGAKPKSAADRPKPEHEPKAGPAPKRPRWFKPRPDPRPAGPRQVSRPKFYEEFLAKKRKRR